MSANQNDASLSDAAIVMLKLKATMKFTSPSSCSLASYACLMHACMMHEPCMHTVVAVMHGIAKLTAEMFTDALCGTDFGIFRRNLR